MLPPLDPAIDLRVQPGRVLCGATVDLGSVEHRRPTDEHRQHHRIQRPALARATGHPAKCRRQRRWDQQHEQDLDEVGDPGRILERMGRVDVEETTAIAGEQLDRLLGSDRTDGDRLADARQAARMQIVRQRLGNPGGDEQDRRDASERENDVQQRTEQVDQKLPNRSPLRRASPRITAAATAIPVAIEVKLATVMPAICAKSESVVSPP